MSAHHTPEEIRKGLTHPVIDGDGHWVEYAPVFAEKIRKVTGDLGANGFLQSQRRGPDALSMKRLCSDSRVFRRSCSSVVFIFGLERARHTS